MGAIPKTQSLPHATGAELVVGIRKALTEAKSVLARPEEFSQESLEALMRAFHLIKGYAQPLGLQEVMSVAHEMEGRIVGLLQGSRTHLTALELRAVLTEGALRLEAVLSKVHELEIREAASREASVTAGSRQGFRVLFWRLANAAQGLALELAREVSLEFSGEDTPLSSHAVEPLFAAFLNAIRNSLDHGSTPSQALSIRLSARRASGFIEVVCQDDGCGIDPAQVRRLAGERELRFEAELERMDDDKVLQLLFAPGFSLSQGVSLLSGRGYGLNIVREAVEARLGGQVRLESRPGRGTRIVARIPE